MKHFILIVISTLFSAGVCFSQDCPGMLKQADLDYEMGNYDRAAKYYQRIINNASCGSNYGQAKQKQAECYRKIKEKKDAEDRKNAQLLAEIARANEEAAFKKCVTIPACEAYLKRFPNGKHADEVRDKIEELKEKERQDSIAREERKRWKIEAQKTAYMDAHSIKVEFANAKDIEGKELINNFGTSLAASDMRYLIPRIKYNSLLPDETEVAVLYCRILRPDGSMIQWPGSPYGFTFFTGIYVKPGPNQSCLLSGFGNATASTFDPGTYRFEIEYFYYSETDEEWYDAELYSANFTLYNSNFTLFGNNWRDALEHCLSEVTEEYDDDSYKGFINAKRRSKMGVYKWSYGTYYFGCWSLGLKDGWGILVKKDGYEVLNCPDCCYFVGNFEDGVKSGKGSCYDAYGNLIYYGDFEDDIPVEPYPMTGYANHKFKCISQGNGNYYLGEVINDQPQGKGIHIQSNGDLWFGEWSPEGKNGPGCNLPFQGTPTIERWSKGVKN